MVVKLLTCLLSCLLSCPCRLGEVSPATAGDPSIAAATREAGILLEEVDAQFF